MNKVNRKLILSLCVLFAAKALSYRLPHDSYSIMDYLFRPIHIGSSVVYPANILTLILFIAASFGILTTERFRRHIKLIGLLYIILILIPIMGLFLDFTRIAYHSAAKDGINSVDIQQSNISLSQVNNSTVIDVYVVLRNYSFHNNEVGIRVYFPKSLREYTGITYYDFDAKYNVEHYSNRNTAFQQITFNAPSMQSAGAPLPSNWRYEDFKYELFDEERTVTILEHGQ